MFFLSDYLKLFLFKEILLNCFINDCFCHEFWIIYLHNLLLLKSCKCCDVRSTEYTYKQFLEMVFASRYLCIYVRVCFYLQIWHGKLCIFPYCCSFFKIVLLHTLLTLLYDLLVLASQMCLSSKFLYTIYLPPQK